MGEAIRNEPIPGTEAFAERLLGAATEALVLFGVYLGERLGLYDALADAGPCTSVELAARTDADERYVREWLEGQTVSGVLRVDDETARATDRRYSLPDAHVEVLTDRDSLYYLAPLGRLLAGAVAPLSDVVEAYRTGEGVPYAAYGSDLHEGQAAMNRPSFLRLLGEEWLPSIPDVDARLRGDPPARVADLGCGHGWSSIGMARSYPNVRVDGYDLDEPSVEAARRNAETYGVADRVSVEVRDASDPTLGGTYTLVTAFECVHDMANPVGALRTMRRLLTDNGVAIVADERVGDAFTAAGTDVERFLYGASTLHCLPVGRSDEPSAETGTIMRSDTFRSYAEEAGFASVEILPIENYFWRFYRLDP
ncbi:class I SAM-dependent methyltransferase [Halegenticoccus tardaugens]|uniref:class I SAM-dependent methyltransferase n=1 Tax=Halegenticoccus tardaugens TaxID=2071624 RepID=UPI00100C2599|nr:class I SAM-dependent methyltransferase [Halegenticoccus tardaugens]